MDQEERWGDHLTKVPLTSEEEKHHEEDSTDTTITVVGEKAKTAHEASHVEISRLKKDSLQQRTIGAPLIPRHPWTKSTWEPHVHQPNGDPTGSSTDSLATNGDVPPILAELSLTPMMNQCRQHDEKLNLECLLLEAASPSSLSHHGTRSKAITPLPRSRSKGYESREGKEDVKLTDLQPRII